MLVFRYLFVMFTVSVIGIVFDIDIGVVSIVVIVIVIGIGIGIWQYSSGYLCIKGGPKTEEENKPFLWW